MLADPSRMQDANVRRPCDELSLPLYCCEDELQIAICKNAASIADVIHKFAVSALLQQRGATQPQGMAMRVPSSKV